MLAQLYVKNFALIEELQIEFAPGLNILTGETGAGKSLIINALNCILGERIPPDVLRKGASRAVVEGTFRNVPPEIERILEENGLESFADELIVRRELSRSGRSRTLVNDCVTQMATLKAITDRLLDLHGQHEHQSLLREENHLLYLDAYGGLEELRAPVRRLYDQIKKDQAQLRELQKNARLLREREDYLRFQIEEIRSLNLDPEEEDLLLQEERILGNYERLMTLCNEIYALLYEEEEAAHSRLSVALERLQELAEINPDFRETARMLEEAKIAVEEVSRSVSDYAGSADFDPDRLEQVRERLAQINRLKKKYGLPVQGILEKLSEMERELSRVENLDSRILELENRIEAAKKELEAAAEKLSEERKKAAARMEKDIMAGLAQIGMENARLRIEVRQIEEETEGGIPLGKGVHAQRNGIDRVHFSASTNPGEDFKPLARIASGGEISRIMLALKSVMAEKDQIGVLVFDEIDIGISGRIAEAVGHKIKELSRTHQVICVTHLPQIASFADRHFSVRKAVKNGETYTFVTPLSSGERVKEIAYLLGGEKITETTLRNAQELIARVRNS